MSCETCRYLKNTQPGTELRATVMYPCIAPQVFPPRADVPIPAAAIDDKGRVRMRRDVFIGMGAGCAAYEPQLRSA